MTFDTIEREFVDLIGGSSSGGSVPVVVPSPQEKRYRAQRAIVDSALEVFTALPGGPPPTVMGQVGIDLQAATSLAGTGNFGGAADKLVQLKGKLNEAISSAKSDPGVKGYLKKLAEVEKMESDLKAGLDELKGVTAVADVVSGLPGIQLSKKATTDIAVSQPAATSLRAMTLVASQLKPGLEKVKSLVPLKREYAAVAVPARRTLGIVKATPKATWTNLERYFNEAEVLATAGDFPAAKLKIVQFNSEAESQLELARKAQNAVNKQLELQPVYEHKLKQTEALLNTISTLPGVRDQIAAVKKALDEARAKGSQSDYKAGCEVIDGLGVTAEECRRLSGSAVNAMARNPGFKVLQEDALATARSLAAVAQPAEAAEARADVMMMIDRIVSGVAVEVNTKALQTLVEGFKRRDEQLAVLRNQAEQSLRMAAGNIQGLTALAGQETSAAMTMRLERLQTAAALKRFEEVAPLAAALDRDTLEAARLAKLAVDAWASRKGEVTLLSSACDTMASCPPAAAEANRLKASLSGLAELATGPNRNVESAISRLDALKASVGLLKTQVVEPFEALKTERDAADHRIVAKTQIVTGVLGLLAQAVADARKGEPAPDGGAAPLRFEAELKAIGLRWESLKGSALTAPELKESEIGGELDTLKAAIETASKPEGVGATVANQKQDESQRAFEADWLVAAAAIKALQTTDVGQGDLAFDQAQTIRNEAPKDYAAALAALGKLKTAVALSQSTASTALAEAMNEADAQGAAVLLDLNALKERAASPLFAPMFEDLEAQHEAITLSARSSNADTVAEAAAEFKTLKRKVAQMNQKIGSSGPDIESFRGVENKLADLKKQLAKPELKEFVPSKLEALNEALAKAQKAVAAKTPDDAMLDLRELQTQVTAARDDAGVAKAKRLAFDNHAKSVEAKIKQLDKDLAYTKTLRPKAAALKSECDTEGSEDAALAKLDELDKEISEAIADPSVAQGRDEATHAAELKKEQDGIVWAANLKTFKSVELPQAERAVAGGGDAALVTELNRLVKSAEDLAKKGDPAAATTQLDIARERVKQIVANPAGATIGSRNELPKDALVFKAAVAKFNTAVLAFPDAVKALAGSELAKPAETKLVQMMSTLSLVFRADAFDKSVQLLSAKETENGARRAQREMALGTVRALQTSLDKNPLLKSLIANPIDAKQIQPAMSAMYYALNRLEGNLMRCCN